MSQIKDMRTARHSEYSSTVLTDCNHAGLEVTLAGGRFPYRARETYAEERDRMRNPVGVIGAGPWGQNHIATLARLGCLGGVVTANADRAAYVRTNYPEAPIYPSVDEAAASLNAFIIATPPVTHYEIAQKLLDLGKHVLVEKPMSLTAHQAMTLAGKAASSALSLMSGHVVLFDTRLETAKRLIAEGRIGEPRYIRSTRMANGRVRDGESVLWNFAPHDVAIIQHLFGMSPVRVHATGAALVRPPHHDIVTMRIDYPGGLCAEVSVNWIHPVQDRRVLVVGTEGALTYEDGEGKSRHGVILSKIPRADHRASSDGEFVSCKKMSPLDRELLCFCDSLEYGAPAVDGGASGAEVIRILEYAQTSLGIH